MILLFQLIQTECSEYAFCGRPRIKYSLSGSTVRLDASTSNEITLQGGFTTVVTINAPVQLEDAQRFVHLQAGQFIFGNQVNQQTASGDNLPADPWPVSSTAQPLALKIETLPVP